MAAAAVPAGAAPIAPAYVPPAQEYEDDEDEVEEVMRPEKPAGQLQSGTSMAVICFVVALVITGSVFAVIYVLRVRGSKTTEAPETSSATSPLTFRATSNATVALVDESEPEEATQAAGGADRGEGTFPPLLPDYA